MNRPANPVSRAAKIALFLALGLSGLGELTQLRAEDYQYKFEQISIPKASAEEAKRPDVSLTLAAEYLEQGAVAWSGEILELHKGHERKSWDHLQGFS